MFTKNDTDIKTFPYDILSQRSVVLKLAYVRASLRWNYCT